jgi:ribosomal protein S18 acetylase RimI-like enzyme
VSRDVSASCDGRTSEDPVPGAEAAVSTSPNRATIKESSSDRRNRRAVDDSLATIDTVAVHADHQHSGVGRSLLTEAIVRSRALQADTLDAWTREDDDTLRWYRAMGFAESDHYLHVYANYYTAAEEPARAVAGLRPDLRPITMFLHATLAEEERLRSEFARVHVCRRFAQAL